MKRYRLVLVIFSVCTFVASNASASTLPFLDDFEDGSATDGAPGNWVQGGSPAATQVVMDGSLVISADMANSPARLAAVLPADLSIRTQVMFLSSSNDSDLAALEARNTGDTFIFAGLRANGDLLLAARDEANGLVVLGAGASPVDPRSTETLVQFDLSGSDLSLTAWALGTPKPSPQLMATTQLPAMAGGIAAGISAPDGAASVAFRYVEAVPEPTTGILAVLAALGFGVRRR